MNIVQIIAALRKFGNYLAGLFPSLVPVVNFLFKPLRKIVDNPLVAPWLSKLTKNKTVQSVWKIIERFYWRTYSKNRLDLAEAPPETVALLRPLFQMCAILCVLIPLTQYTLWPVEIEAFSGFKGTAPGWSVVLWMICLPGAWAALLTGAARSNRIAFMVAAISASYFLITCVVLLPRSFFNALAPLSILVSLIYCEHRLKGVDKKVSTIFGIANALVCGIAAGIPIVILTPIRPFLGSVISLPGPVISIGGGALFGAILGLICLVTARRFVLPVGNVIHDAPNVATEEAPQNSGMALNAWSVTLLLIIFLFAGLSRGSLAQSGSELISSLALTNNYLWPLWYFMGVGILHKISKSSKTLASAIADVMPRRVLKPLLILTLAISLLTAFSEKICLFLSLSSNQVLANLLPFFYAIYSASKPFIWSSPLNTLTVHWFTNVLLFDLALVIVLSIQRRLTNEALIRILFLNIFAFLLIWEYVFQLSSFARTPTHSVVVLCSFAIGLLWLIQTVGWDLSSKSSPAWPSSGRLAVYGGIATFAILEIHARSACKDFKLMNELFLTMFHGVIDVGLPYYFLVWTSNRVDKLPIKISTMLGLFSLGALASFAFNVLEKFAGAGWSMSALSQIVNSQSESLRAIGTINIDLAIPSIWFFLRAVIYVALLSVLYLLAKKRVNDTDNSSKTILFVLVAFASGIASFSNTFVELPLPTEARALLAPCHQSLLFNCYLVQSYLAYWIPALILGISQLYSKEKSTKMFLLCIPLAIAAHFLISWSFSEFEVYCRASGSFYTIIAILCGIFVALVGVALRRISPQEQEAQEQDERKNKATILTPRTLLTLIALAEIILIPFAIGQTNLKFNNLDLPPLTHNVVIPTTWQKQNSPNVALNETVTTFSRKAQTGGTSLLQIGTVDSSDQGTKELLKRLFTAAANSGRYPNLAVIAIEPWNKYYPNALACHFTYELPDTKPAITMSGLSILVPRTDKVTEFYTLHTSPSEIDREQWEMAYTINKLNK
ncbi:hypothetical protein BH10CYA1_BH10CYA1_54920 [soil metagenome]